MKKYTLTDFQKQYPNDDACLDKLYHLRFDNLICPKCDNTKPFNKVKNRRSYQCPCCGFQVYPTKGTIFEKTTTPLTYWFYAIFLQTTTRNGVAAKELERQLDICYKTALRMAHQIKILMAQKEGVKLSGIVEIDETSITMKKVINLLMDMDKILLRTLRSQGNMLPKEVFLYSASLKDKV